MEKINSTLFPLSRYEDNNLFILLKECNSKLLLKNNFKKFSEKI